MSIQAKQTTVTVTTYDIELKLTQDQLDWLVSFCGEIGGNLPSDNTRLHTQSPLREITDNLYTTLNVYRKNPIDVRKFHYVNFKKDDYEVPF